MKAMTGQLVDHDGGATAIEYALLAGMIALVIITTVTTLGTSMEDLFRFIESHL